VLALCGLTLAACSLLAPHVEKPTLSVTRIQLLGGSLLQQNLQVTFHVQNPNHRPLPVQGVRAELRVGGDPIASGISSHAFVVPAMGDADFDMTVTADMALGLIKLARRSDAIDYEIAGEVDFDLAFFRTLPFHQSGRFSLDGSGITH